MNKNNASKIIFNSAAVSGIYLGLYFSLKYLIYMYIIPYTLLSLLYCIAIIGTPFVVYFLVKKFRSKVLESSSVFPFNLSWLYGMLLYIFASIISMPLHYYFYKFRMPTILPYIRSYIDNLPSSITQAIPDFNNTINQAMDTLELTPVHQMLFSDFSNNMLYGAVVSLIIGLILKRK